MHANGNASGLPTASTIDFSSVRGVLFDIDGTLTDSDVIHFKAFQELLCEHKGGKPIDWAFYRKHISGRHNPDIAFELFPDRDEAWRTAWYLAKEARYRELAGSTTQPLPGLGRFMDWIAARGLRKVAVTNAPRANVELMLASLKLDAAFEAVILGEECEFPKPHPLPYQLGLQQLGIEPHSGLVLEDSPTGIKAGVAAGIPVIGITTGQEASVLWEAGASAVVKDYDEICELVERVCA